MKNSIYAMLGLVFLFTISISFTEIVQDVWIVPASYENMENPVSADKESMREGKGLYAKHCKSCHGKEGLGDGSKAAQLDTPSGDFSTEEFQSQSDGALFYKIREGRDDMPGFDKKLPDDEEVWSVVNILRTLGDF